MKRLLLIALVAVALSSCSSSLYNWGGGPLADVSAYDRLSYRYFDKQTPESICDLVCMYDDLVTNPGGTRRMPPPGVCAEYGYLLLMPTTAEAFAKHATSSQRRHFDGSDYGALFSERGKAMLQREIELYPEAARFIKPILERF